MKKKNNKEVIDYLWDIYNYFNSKSLDNKEYELWKRTVNLKNKLEKKI